MLLAVTSNGFVQTPEGVERDGNKVLARVMRRTAEQLEEGEGLTRFADLLKEQISSSRSN